MSEPFNFLIPFISKKIANDFDAAVSALAATLTTCLTQTDPADVHVSVCCHEMPEWMLSEFPTVAFIESPLGPPRVGAELNELRYDKLTKLRRLAVHISSLDPGHVMKVDGDDLIGRNLVAHVREIGPTTTVLFAGGYIVSSSTHLGINVMEDMNIPFWDACGSCCAAFMKKEDLPVNMADTTPWKLWNKLRGHKSWKDDMSFNKRPLIETEEPLIIYVKDHGSNLTMVASKGKPSSVSKKAAAKPVSELVGDKFVLPDAWARSQLLS